MINAQHVLIGILPSIGALAIFFFVVRGIIRADRNERAHIAKEEERIAAEHAKTETQEEQPPATK